MKYLKKLTQSVTMILIVLVAVGTPFLMGRVGSWLGVVAWLDSIWSPTLLGWIGTIVSRAIGIAVWVVSDYFLITWGERYGWFWVEPEQPQTYRGGKDPSVDKSGEIALAVVASVFVLVIFEFLFRLGAGVEPPYLLPMGE